jgi:hypothetical protein
MISNLGHDTWIAPQENVFSSLAERRRATLDP